MEGGIGGAGTACGAIFLGRRVGAADGWWLRWACDGNGFASDGRAFFRRRLGGRLRRVRAEAGVVAWTPGLGTAAGLSSARS